MQRSFALNRIVLSNLVNPYRQIRIEEKLFCYRVTKDMMYLLEQLVT